jgi:nucleoside transporter
MNSITRVQLCAMMFLNFLIWGFWFVTMGSYLTKGSLNANDVQSGLAYGTQCLGAIIAPFIIGFIADRFFDAQKILGVLHIVGAGLMYLLSNSSTFDGFYTLLLSYMILYMPTLALVNAIALKQINNAEKEFGGIRVWGTIGWIVAGLLIAFFAWEPSAAVVTDGTKENASEAAKALLKQKSDVLSNTFLAAAVVSAILGVYSFFLPKTPPPKKGQEASIGEIIGLDALKILKDKNYLVFFIASILICIPLAFYYGNAGNFLGEIGVAKVSAKMSMGQMSETLFLFLLPVFFKRFGIKQMLLIGMGAWILRYALFSFGNADSGVWLLYAGIILHGICYDFFFVTGQIYTDQVAGPKVRSAAQGLITLATYGVGMYIGFWLAGNYVKHHKIGDAQHNWKIIWLMPCLFAAGVALLFFITFRNNKKIAH